MREGLWFCVGGDGTSDPKGRRRTHENAGAAPAVAASRSLELKSQVRAVIVKCVYDSTMKLTSINSSSAPRSAGGYSQAVDISGVQRLLFVSGQIPETVTGDVPADFAAQARLVWQNVIAQLEVAGMSISNLVKVTTYLSSREFAVANRGVREEVLQGHAQH